MSTSRLSTVSLNNGLPKSNNIWDGTTGFFESIATVTVSSGSQANIEFANIPSTYTHLQIRGILRCSRASTLGEAQLRYNGNNTATDYRNHGLAGSGTAATAYADQTTAGGGLAATTGANSTSNIFGAVVWDILDYSNTNKYKTDRALSGNDQNGSGLVRLTSGLWMKTNAIDKITVVEANGSNWVTYSTLTLYGIRGF